MDKEQSALGALELYPDKVRLVYHHYPGSDYSYLLAQALEFAGQDGRFWELHDRLVADVPEDEAELDELLGNMNFDMESFDEAMADSRYRDVIDRAIAEAQASGISSFGHYVNGARFSGSAEGLLKAVEAAIESVEGGD